MNEPTIKDLANFCGVTGQVATIYPNNNVILRELHALDGHGETLEFLVEQVAKFAEPAELGALLGSVSELESDPDYRSLDDVLTRAYHQAASGKGAVRHAQGQPFDCQPMQQLCLLYGVGFALGQAAKKSQEAMRLPGDRAVHELLGAINYLAGAVLYLESQADKPVTNDNAAPRITGILSAEVEKKMASTIGTFEPPRSARRG